MCAAIKSRRDVQTVRTRLCLTGTGATTDNRWCKAGEFVVALVVEVVGSGSKVGCSSAKGKNLELWGARGRSFVRPQKQALYSPKFLS